MRLTVQSPIGRPDGLHRALFWRALMLLGLVCMTDMVAAQALQAPLAPQERLDAAERQRLRYELRQRAMDERHRNQQEYQGAGAVSRQAVPGGMPGYPGPAGYAGNVALPAGGLPPGAAGVPPAPAVMPAPHGHRHEGAVRLSAEERQILRRQLREGHGRH